MNRVATVFTNFNIIPASFCIYGTVFSFCPQVDGWNFHLLGFHFQCLNKLRSYSTPPHFWLNQKACHPWLILGAITYVVWIQSNSGNQFTVQKPDQTKRPLSFFHVIFSQIFSVLFGGIQSTFFAFF